MFFLRAVLLATLVVVPSALAHPPGGVPAALDATLHALVDEASTAAETAGNASASRYVADAQAAAAGLVARAGSGEAMGISAAHAHVFALLRFAELDRAARASSDPFTDGDDGCTENSTCGRHVAEATAAAEAGRAALAQADGDLARAWATLTTVQALEIAVVAETVLAVGGTSLTSHERARVELLALRSYDPSSGAYQRILTQMATGALSAARIAEAATRIADAALAADANGTAIDAAALAERRATAVRALGDASGIGEESAKALREAREEAANGTYPGLVAAYARYRAALEYDRLLFAVPDESLARAKMQEMNEELRAAVKTAHASAVADGFAGTLLGDALARSDHRIASGLASETALTQENAGLRAALQTHSAFVSPVVVRPPAADEDTFAIAAVAAALAGAALAAVALTALLRRRKA